MVQYLDEYSSGRQLLAASFLQREEEDLNEYYEDEESPSNTEKQFDVMEPFWESS